jgi:ketosteroid isomerase-like protein
LPAARDAPAPAGLTDADRATIDSLHTEFAAAVVAGDFAKVASMYTEGRLADGAERSGRDRTAWGSSRR